MATYTPDDNQKKAQELITLLRLEEQDLGNSLNYEYATSWCSDCPQREREPSSYDELEFGVRYARKCCKQNGQWEEEHQRDFEHQNRITNLIQSLVAYVAPSQPEDKTEQKDGQR